MALRTLGAAAVLLSIGLNARADEPVIRLHAVRTSSRIVVDGDLDDEGWRGVPPIDTWYETSPGDNVPPKVKSVGYLAYDDRSLYAGFRFEDPDPSAIRAPVSDRD